MQNLKIQPQRKMNFSNMKTAHFSSLEQPLRAGIYWGLKDVQAGLP